MKIKYQNLWTERNGSSYCNDYGEITPIAQNWISECSKLTSEQIKIGLRDLAYRKNPSFPPTAIEFVAHCREMGADDCVDEILDYLDQPTESEWWWKSQIAFNVFKRLHYNPANNEKASILKNRILDIYRKLNMATLDDIPPQPIALPVKESTKVDKERGKFQAKMFFTIMQSRPDLLGVDQDEDTAAMFMPHKSNELMYAWYEQGKPDMCVFLRGNGVAV